MNETLCLTASNSSRKKSETQIFSLLIVAIAFLLVRPAQATSYTWTNAPTGNWSTSTSWNPNSPAGGPTAADTAIFGIGFNSASSNTVNNVVDLGFAGTLTALTYNSTNPNTFQVTQIPTGQTLNVTGKVTIGQNNGVLLVSQAYMTGSGTFVTSTTNLTIQSYGSASGANSTANLNLSGLSTFIYTNKAATLSVGDTTTGLTRAGGNLILAGVSNLITVSNINLGTSSSAQAGPLSTLVLGAGTNMINVANLNVANNKNSVNVTFGVPNGGLRIRGIGGTDADRANIILGNRNQAGSGTCLGQMLLNGGRVDIRAATLTIGANPNTGTPSPNDVGSGNFLFDTGTVDATAVVIATTATANVGFVNGTLTVGPNARLVVGSGNLSLLNQSVNENTPSSGTLNISNGVVVCNGNLIVTTNAGGTGVSTVNFVNGGRLTLGNGSIAGSPASPISNFNLIENSTIEFVQPSLTQSNIVANTLTWPANDSLLTIVVDNLPADLSPGTTITLFSFGGLANGTFTAPVLQLPAGVTGNLSLVGNTIVLTITGGVGPGIGGIDQLVNPGFELTPAKTGWTTVGNTPLITIGSATYPNSPSGACPPDGVAQLVVSHSGTNVADIGGSNVAGGSTNSWSQLLTASPGATYTAGGYTYVSHEDLMAGRNTFFYEVDFLNSSNTLIASFESYIITNLSCGSTTPFPVDIWTFLAATNAMQISSGVNTGVVVSNVASGILTAPPGSSKVQFRAVFVQRNATDGGSVYLDDANLGFAGTAVPPSITAATPNLITMCTNTSVSCTATSTVTTFVGAQVIATTNVLGGTPVTITNGIGSLPLSVTGIGTSSLNIHYALATNTVYSSLIIQAIDADGLVASTTNTLDTIQPILVIEAADFNFTTNGGVSGGGFFDTPANGGLAFYTNQIGLQGTDENKNPARTGTQSYYRPSDAVIIQAASPGSGTPPTSTEQKFVTALANGDTTDIEVEVGFNSVGDWMNYTRTFGPGGSAPAGTYNVYGYLATSGSGIQGTLSQVTSDPTQPSQTTTVLGTWGTPSFTDNGFNNYRYVPLVDQFGNTVAITVTNGLQTFRSTATNNPNFGFYLFVPVVPIVVPTLVSIAPNGSVPFQSSNQLSFTISPESGAGISTNSISLTLNGNSAALSFTAGAGGAWTVTTPLQLNTLYSGTINVTNGVGVTSTFTVNFDTFDMNNYQWEGVDYDFSTNGGANAAVFLDSPYPTGNTSAATNGASDGAGNAGGIINSNSYFGFPTGDSGDAIAQQGIDVNYVAASGIQHQYRNDTVGTEVSTDFVRPKFAAAQALFGDPSICAFDLGWFNGGDWVNYTRTYPTNTYNVWARLAGGNGPFSGTTLSVVTNGVGTSLQMSNVLGTFSDPNAAGWQVWHWIPLLDSLGNKVQVQLGGVSTLKLTSGNNLNAQFFMLVPAVTQASPFSISASRAPGQLLISFPTQTGHNYTVWQSSSLKGTFTPIVGPISGNGSVNVVTQAVTTATSFYRVSAQ